MKTENNQPSFDVPIFRQNDTKKLVNASIAQKVPTEKLGDALARYMNEMSIDRKKLTELTGISDSAIYFYLNNRHEISADYLTAICIALRLHPLRSKYLFSLTRHRLRFNSFRDLICLNYLFACAFNKDYNLSNCNQQLKQLRMKPLTSLCVSE